MNPDTNRFEAVEEVEGKLLRALNDEPVPDDWPVFNEGQELTLRGYRWKVEKCHESKLTLEAVGPLSKGQQLRNRKKRRGKKRAQK